MVSAASETVDAKIPTCVRDSPRHHENEGSRLQALYREGQTCLDYDDRPQALARYCPDQLTTARADCGLTIAPACRQVHRVPCTPL